MRILLLSAYDAVSHRQWREALLALFPDEDWTTLVLPARYFNWRIRGNSLSWAFQHRSVLEQTYDLVIATSMVDLSSLRGFVPALAAIPTMVYFHENQFAYPHSEQQFSSVEPQILNIYTALAADKVVFNSQYNRDTFLHGAKQLLKKLPDQVPHGLVELLAENADVLPVPIMQANNPLSQPEQEGAHKDRSQPLHLLWNHRWEYDKAPERFLAAVKICAEQGVKLSLSVVGQQFRNMPAVFDEAKRYWDDNYPGVIKHWGYVEAAADYIDLLQEADGVVSTALHDFQGLAVLEAVASGCIPIVPNRLCYGEWFAEDFLYPSSIDSPDTEAEALAAHIANLTAQKLSNNLPKVPEMQAFSLAALKTQYQAIFQQTMKRHSL